MLTTIVATVLVFLPGGVLGFGVPAGRDRWAAWAAAPVLTLGLTAMAMAWLPVLGLPNSVGWLLAAELVLAAAAVCAARLIHRRRTSTAGRPAPDVPGGDSGTRELGAAATGEPGAAANGRVSHTIIRLTRVAAHLFILLQSSS